MILFPLMRVTSSLSVRRLDLRVGKLLRDGGNWIDTAEHFAAVNACFGHDSDDHQWLQNRVELEHLKADCREHPLPALSERTADQIL